MKIFQSRPVAVGNQVESIEANILSGLKYIEAGCLGNEIPLSVLNVSALLSEYDDLLCSAIVALTAAFV